MTDTTPIGLRKWLRDAFWAFPKTGILVRVTNMGLGFVLMTLVVAFGATNTGNNGLYILVSLFLAALVVSGVVSRRNVERVSVRLEGPDEIFAGEPTRFRLLLQNKGRVARRALLVKIAGSSSPVLFAKVDPGQEASRGLDLVFPRRGKRSIESLLVYSGYPIGLFRKGRVHPVREERVVFPRLVRMRAPRRDPRVADAGDPRSRKSGRSVEIRHLREAGPGDDRRDIHWPQTARQGRVIVKERAAEEGREALVVLDTHRPANADAAWDKAFEVAVSEAASIALDLLARGESVGLLAGATALTPSTGAAQRRAVLTALALVSSSIEAVAGPAAAPGAAIYRISPRLDERPLSLAS